MKAPYTGEPCTAITPAQGAALLMLANCRPAPHFVPNIRTAVALLNRGWITRAVAGEPLHTRSLYHITPRGATALRIGGFIELHN